MKKDSPLTQFAQQYDQLVTKDLWDEALAEHEAQERSYVARMNALPKPACES